MISEINGELVVVEKNGGITPVFRDYPGNSAILFDSNLTNLDIKITPNFITNRYVDKDNGQYFYIVKSNTKHKVEIKSLNSSNLSKLEVPKLEPRQTVSYEVKPAVNTFKEFNIVENTNPNENLIQIIKNTKEFFKIDNVSPDSELATLIIITDISDIKISSNIIETFLYKTTLDGKMILFYSILKQSQFLSFQYRGYSRTRKRYDVKTPDLILEVN